MDLGALIIGFSILALCVPYVAGPFFQKQASKKGRVDHQKKVDLKATRQAVLAALRDLEFDFKTGKVVEEDYAVLRSQLLLEAASLMPQNEPQNDELEALIQARRAKLAKGNPCRQCDSPLISGDLYCPSCGAPVKPRCSVCGEDLAVDARFCSHCGTSTASENKDPKDESHQELAE